MTLDSLFFRHAQVCIDLAVISSHNGSLTSSLGPRHAIQQSLDLDLGNGNAFFAQEDFIGVKSLAFPSVLANICRPVMGTVSVLSFGKVGENRKKKMEKIWRIFVEHFSFAILLHSVSRGLVRLATCDLYRFRLESLWDQPTSRGTGDFDLTYRLKGPIASRCCGDVVPLWLEMMRWLSSMLNCGWLIFAQLQRANDRMNESLTGYISLKCRRGLHRGLNFSPSPGETLARLLRYQSGTASLGFLGGGYLRMDGLYEVQHKSSKFEAQVTWALNLVLLCEF